MSSTLLVPIAVAGLLGSVHCAAMCGSFVAAYSRDDGHSRSAWSHLGYNAGRLLAYVGLGTLAGALGQAIDLAGSAVEVGRVAALFAGVLTIFWGLSALLATQGIRFGRVRLPERFLRRTAAFVARFYDRPPLERAFALGLSSALLPCGWLYAFVLTSAGTGSPFRGASVMFAFWLGTAPMLFGLGMVLGRALSRVRAHVPILSAAVILGLGLFTVFSRVSLPAFALTASSASKETSHAAVPDPMASPACHSPRSR